MFNFIAKWLIKDVCPKKNGVNDEINETLHQYMRLMGRVFVALTAVAVIFILITAISPKSKDLALNLVLDGQTLSGYVGVVLGTVVALAGSLLAIILAQRAVSLQREQGDQVIIQNKLMALEQEREYTILYDQKLGEYQKLMLELSGLLGSCLAVAGELRQKASIEAALVAAKYYKKYNNINSIFAGLHGLSIIPSHSDMLLKKYGVEIKYLSNQIEALRLKIMEIASNQTARRFFADNLLQSAPKFINSAILASSEKVISQRSSEAILMADLLAKNDGERELDQDLCFLLMLLSPVKAREDSLFLKELIDSFPSGIEQVIAVFKKEHEANAKSESDANPVSNGLEKAAKMSNLQRGFVFSDEIVSGLNRIGEVFSKNSEMVEKIFSGKLDSGEVRGFVKRVYRNVVDGDLGKILILEDEVKSSGDLAIKIRNANEFLNMHQFHVAVHDLVFDDTKEFDAKSALPATRIFKLVSNFFSRDLSSMQGGDEIYAKAYNLISEVFNSCDFGQIENSEYVPVIYNFYLRGLAAPSESSFSIEDRIASIDDWIDTGCLVMPAYITAGDGIRLMLDRLSWLDKFDVTDSDVYDLLERIEESLEFTKSKASYTTEHEREELHGLLERKIKLIKSRLSQVR